MPFFIAEKKLWNAVLLLFFKDAEIYKRDIVIVKNKIRVNKGNPKLIRIYELRWIRLADKMIELEEFVDTEWFDMVCCYAGQDFEIFREKSKKLLKGEINIHPSKFNKNNWN